MSEDVIDAEALARRYSVEELAERAENYFASVPDWTYLLSKPFGATVEAPTILAHFAAMLSALELTPGMQVLDFGAGSCWTSHMLAQLGCAVVASDVSSTALAIGKRRFEQQPLFGDCPTARFLPFDGHRIGLGDESVDRVACMDAFHHVPNWEEVLAEFHRVLVPGGRAVLAEGGPRHSVTPQAQYEMRNFEVVERDLVVERFEELACDAGFAEMKVAIYAGLPWLVAPRAFDTHLEAGDIAASGARHFLDNHRLVVLSKAGRSRTTSRSALGLAAEVHVEMLSRTTGRARVVNVGEATWLGAAFSHGAVNLGIQLHGTDGKLRNLDFMRVPLGSAPDTVVEPGEDRQVSFAVGDLADDEVLAFDLVAEGVAWFAQIGRTTVTVARS